MSRIGKRPIIVPKEVEVSFDDDLVKVKGPKGELSQEIDDCVEIKMEDGVVTLSRKSEAKDHKAKHGLYRALINNMVVGVSEGYKIQQELIGVGYKAETKGQILELNLGYSHAIYLQVPYVRVTDQLEEYILL